MGRITRYSYDIGYFHVICRGNNKQIIFKDNQDYVKFANLIRKYKPLYNIKLHHYAFMPNHVHLLLKASTTGDLSKIMQHINLSFSYWHKFKYGHIGQLWQGRFTSMQIGSDEYLLECGRYIELNPVRAGLVHDPAWYNWSSYNALAFGKNCTFLDSYDLYTDLGTDSKERQNRYREIILEAVPGSNSIQNLVPAL